MTRSPVKPVRRRETVYGDMVMGQLSAEDMAELGPEFEPPAAQADNDDSDSSLSDYMSDLSEEEEQDDSTE